MLLHNVGTMRGAKDNLTGSSNDTRLIGRRLYTHFCPTVVSNALW
jgi:hypothetical protein